MTEIWVLCAWDGWYHIEGTDLDWVVESDGTLTIEDGLPPVRICSLQANSWRAVTSQHPMEHG